MKNINKIKEIKIGCGITKVEYNGDIIIKSDINKILNNLKNNTNEIYQLNKQNKSIKENKDNIPIDKEPELIKDNFTIYNYNSDRHKHNIICKYNNKTNNQINQFITTKGYSHYLPNKSNIQSLDSDLKIITVRNTDIGITDNINQTNTRHKTLGYPYKRKVINLTVKNSKDNLESRHNQLFYTSNLIDNRYKIVELTNIHKKKYLSEMFISRVFKLYLYLLNDNKVNHKFNYHNIKKKIKVLSGSEFIHIFNDTINLIKTNNKRLSEYEKELKKYPKDKELKNKIDSLQINNNKLFHKNGLYKYNIQVMEYLLKDIIRNGYLDKEYKLTRLNGVKIIDRTNIKNDDVEKWNKQKIQMLKKLKDTKIKKSNNNSWLAIQKQKRIEINQTKQRIKEIQQLHNQ